MESLVEVYNLYKARKKQDDKPIKRIPRDVFITGEYASVVVLSNGGLKIELTTAGLIKLNNIFSDDYTYADKDILSMLLFDYIENGSIIVVSSKKLRNPVGDRWTFPKRENPIDYLVLDGCVVYKNV